MSTHATTICINADSPMEASQKLMQQAVLPLLRQVNADAAADERVMLWAAAICGLAGGMAQCLGTDVAKSVLQDIVPMLVQLGESNEHGALH